MLRRINRALPELMIGIILWGIVEQLVGVWFVSDWLRYSTGVWIGILTACGMAVHMAVILGDAMDIGAENAVRNKVAFHSVLRYLVVVAVFFITAKFRLGNVIAVFIGVMGLKIGAYLQPLTHKWIINLTGRGDESSDNKI